MMNLQTNAAELVRCLVRDLGTHASALDYAERIARQRCDRRDRKLQRAYADAAQMLRDSIETARRMRESRIGNW